MKKIFFTLMLVLACISVTIAAAEILLRASGHGPWPETEDASLLEKAGSLYEPDPVLGWRPAAGTHEKTAVLQCPASGEIRRHTNTYTFLPDGSRAAAPGKDGPYDVIVLGCSYSFGELLNDRETYPWKLQELAPRVRVGNYARSAYSTYQSLLLLEELFSRGHSPKTVLYGWFHFHEERNVNRPVWIEYLNKYAKKARISLPYVSLGADGELVRHPPESYPAAPFQRSLALVPYLQARWFDFRKIPERRMSGARKATLLLIREMDRLAKSRGAEFYAVLLGGESKEYTAFLEKNGIRYIRSNVSLTPEHMIECDVHPNEAANIRWARLIHEELVRRGSVPPEGGPDAD